MAANSDVAEMDARELVDDETDRWAVNGEKLGELLLEASFDHIRVVFQQYATVRVNCLDGFGFEVNFILFVLIKNTGLPVFRMGALKSSDTVATFCEILSISLKTLQNFLHLLNILQSIMRN